MDERCIGSLFTGSKIETFVGSLFSQNSAPGHYLDVVVVLGLVGDDGAQVLAVLGGDDPVGLQVRAAVRSTWPV